MQNMYSDGQDRPRVAFVGTGMIATAHLRAARHARASILGVLASRPERSQRAAQEWRLPEGYPDLAALISDRPDVVHICSPNDTHAPYAEELINAGINVVVEKPIATTTSDALRIARAAQENHVLATVPYVYRYHPLVREIRARRIAGEFGDVALVHGSYLQDWMMSPNVGSWRVSSKTGGSSRAFADIGTHWCDLAEFVSGETFTEVMASTNIIHPTRPIASGTSFGAPLDPRGEHIQVETEDTAIVTFRTARGITANVVVSQVSPGRKNRLWIEIDGVDGSAVFDQETPESIWLGSEHGSMTLHRGEGQVSRDQHRLNCTPPGHSQGWTDAFDAFVVDTYAAVRGKEHSGLPTVDDGVRSVRLVEAVLKSAETGEWTTV